MLIFFLNLKTNIKMQGSITFWFHWDGHQDDVALSEYIFGNWYTKVVPINVGDFV